MAKTLTKSSKIFLTAFLFVIIFLTSCAQNVPNISKVDSQKAKGSLARTKVAEINAKLRSSRSFQGAASHSNDKLKVITEMEEYNSNNLPLIAAIPQRNIYLYGVKPTGVLLYIDGEGRFFKWDYMTPRFVLPMISVGDYDNDGINNELAIITYAGSGSGVALEELHIIKLGEKQYLSEDSSSDTYFQENPNYFKALFFKPDDYLDQIDQVVKMKTYRKKGKLTAEIKVGQKTTVISLADEELDGEPLKIIGFVCRDVVLFETKNNGIHAQFGFGVTTENFASPIYIGDIYADVKLVGDKFQLSNIHFSQEEE